MNNFLKEKNISISILDVDNLEIFLISLSEFIKKNKLNDIVIHFDIMDGNFVPHYGVDLDLIKLAKKYKFFVDVHLMCSNPKEYIDKAIELGADNITVHYEIDNLYENLKYLNKIKEELSEKNKEFSIGISIKPDTDIKKIFNYSKMCDIILLMSVYPGLGGQSYMNKINKKIEIAKDMKKMVQVDGGVNDSTIIKPNSLGVNSFVIGSYITKDLNNMSEKIMKIENIIKGN